MKGNNWLKFFFLALTVFITGKAFAQDSTLVKRFQKKQQQNSLHFPGTVARFYKKNGFKLAWVVDEVHAKHTFSAMVLLDCVLQYGLLHTDYHPAELTYDHLQTVMKKQEAITEWQKSTFDVLLTDAMITLVNHLHFGKLNPIIKNKNLDTRKTVSFHAENTVLKAINSKDLTAVILSVQPKSEAYIAMQNYMRLVKGQYVGDCYEIPEYKLRKVVINMERLRWTEHMSKQYIPKKLLYLTCSIKDGLPIFHKDIYHQDQALEAAFYNQYNPAVKAPTANPARIKLKKD